MNLAPNAPLNLRGLFCWVLAAVLLGSTLPAQAERYQPVAERVQDSLYALIGPTDDREYDNDGLNNNQAFLVTPAGVVLFDSGASRQGAERIAAAIAAVTPQPVKWVVNTGSQDHRWLGNGYFRAQGAEIIALAATVETQQRLGAGQIAALKGALKDRLEGTEPVTAARALPGNEARLELGGEPIEILLTDAHFKGDAMIWLPARKVAITGDLVYVDRILGVNDESSVARAWESWQRLEALAPERLIPGHGRVCDLPTARRDTGDYYAFLVNTVGAAAKDMQSLDEVVKRYAELPQFQHLKHYDSWHRTVINRAYLEFEGL